MKKEYVTENFRFEYTESNIDESVLWESHCHAEFEMIAVVEGDISIMIEGESHRLTENQRVIIPPLTYHTITSNKKGIYRRITTLFGLRSVPEDIRQAFSDSTARVAITFSVQNENLRNICEQNNGIYAPLAEALMIQIFYDSLQLKRETQKNEADEFIRKAVEYIDGHLDEKIRLEDIARSLSCSKSSFCHLFESKMKITPKQYILQKKFAFADMLINDGCSPSVAAMKIGYENYSDFYRVYLKIFGKSPTGRKSKPDLK